MGSQHVSYSWQHYDTNLKTSLQDFLVDDSLVDVTLVAKDQSTFRAHKLVLAAASTYFREVFARCVNPTASLETVVVLPNASRADLNSLMQYWYSGQLNASHDQLVNLKALAETLRIRGLTKIIDAGILQMQQKRRVERTEDGYEGNVLSPPARKRRVKRCSSNSSGILPTDRPNRLPPSASVASPLEDGSIDSDISVTEVLGSIKPELVYDTTAPDGNNSVGIDDADLHKQDGDETEGAQTGGVYPEEEDYGGEDSSSMIYYDNDSNYDENGKTFLMGGEDTDPGGGEAYASGLSDLMPGTSSATGQDPVPRWNEGGTFRCCERVFVSRLEYEIHVQQQHRQGEQAERISCALCTSTFGMVHNYRAHLRYSHGLGTDHPTMLETYSYRRRGYRKRME